MLKIGFICPTYNARSLHTYTHLALESFFDTTPGGTAIVVDDASTSWDKTYEQSLHALAHPHKSRNLKCHHFTKYGGLTRSWNKGLAIADELDLDYVIAGNNDVIFTTKWAEGLLHALTNGYALVGPLSNAPGITAKGKQEIENYINNFRLTDNRKELNDTAELLHQTQLGRVIESPINGFFQMASMSSWRRGKYSSTAYYRPVNTHTSTGKRNPTPLMTLNEDELQHRWAKKKMKSAVVLSSFIFHYRAVSRGNRYKRGKWYRQ